MVQIDMDMPKTCRDCPFWEGAYGCLIVEGIPAWQNDIAENGKNKRSEHCSLIEIKNNYYDSFDICKSCSNKFGCDDGSNLSAKKCWFRKKKMKYDEVTETEPYGIYSKFKGIVVTLEENGDLVFHCESKDKAMVVLNSLFKPTKENNNEEKISG